jgi:carbonic anhydrase
MVSICREWENSMLSFTRDSDPELFLKELLSGNRRFASGAGIHPHQTPSRRRDLVSAQHPFAAIIGCSDSRVPPEIIFDCGLGDLFVIRLAGQVVNDSTLASLQFLVDYVGVTLIVVLGHSHCAAVESAMRETEAPDPLGSLLRSIKPAVAASAGLPGDPLENAVLENIRLNARRLLEIGWKKRPAIFGAYYSLKSGLVTMLE